MVDNALFELILWYLLFDNLYYISAIKIISFGCYKDIITVNRWFYDPARKLHQDCKTPQQSDENLRRYTLKTKVSETPTAIITTVAEKTKKVKLSKPDKTKTPVIKKNSAHSESNSDIEELEESEN